MLGLTPYPDDRTPEARKQFISNIVTSTPDLERFFQALKRQVPPFSVNSYPSVQNRSTFQLIYQVSYSNITNCFMIDF
jgi:hypothetical protein